MFDPCLPTICLGNIPSHGIPPWVNSADMGGYGKKKGVQDQNKHSTSSPAIVSAGKPGPIWNSHLQHLRLDSRGSANGMAPAHGTGEQKEARGHFPLTDESLRVMGCSRCLWCRRNLVTKHCQNVIATPYDSTALEILQLPINQKPRRLSVARSKNRVAHP